MLCLTACGGGGGDGGGAAGGTGGAPDGAPGGSSPRPDAVAGGTEPRPDTGPVGGTRPPDARPTTDLNPPADVGPGDALAAADGRPSADARVEVDGPAAADAAVGPGADAASPADAAMPDANGSIDPGPDATLVADGGPADASAGADATDASDAGVCVCGPEERCRPGTLVCEPIVRCTGHADCGAGACVDRICEAGVPGACACAPGWTCDVAFCEMAGPCAGDGDCPDGTYCAGGYCGACRDNDHCPGETRCLNGFCREPRQCFGDEACLSGRVCAAEGFCTAAMACEEDALGDLGAPERAYPVGFETLAHLVACELSNDWFLVDAPRPVVISTLRPATAGVLGLELYAENQPFGALDYDLGRPGASWVSAPAGRWLVRVSASPGSGGPYTLDVRSGCVEDAHERPWRNDTAAGATSLSVGRTSGTLCVGDVDVFLFRGPDAGAVRLEAAGNVQASVNGRPLPADLVPGDLVEVRGAAGAAYTLVTEKRRDAPNRCTLAADLALDTPTEAFVLAGPDDFVSPCSLGESADGVWRVRLDTPSPLYVSLPGATPNSALAVYTDCAAPPIACASGVENLQLPEQPAGTYYVVVEGPVAGTLTARASADGGGVCGSAGQLRIGFDTRIEIPEGPGGLDGPCLDPALGQIALRFAVPIAARVTLTARSDDGRVVQAALRGDCANSLTEYACEAGPETTVVADRLEVGEYFALVAGGSGAVDVRVEVVPAP
jgi:hypothetical protein